MKRCDRLICIACSFIPAVAVWMSYRRYDEFVSVFENLLCFDRSFTFRTTFVLNTIHFWPLLVALGWGLLVPAMFSKPWAKKLRIVLSCCFIVLGPLLYTICVDGLFDPMLNFADRELLPKGKIRQQSDGAVTSEPARSAASEVSHP